MYETQIELLIAIPLGILIAVIIAVALDKLNVWIGAIGIIIGLGCAWMLAPVIQLVMIPIHNSLFYGYQWTLLEIFGLLWIITIVIMGGKALINLWLTKGTKLWG